MSSDINVQTFSGKVNITSNLLVGSSHLFVDTINNRVGLVTTTPDAGIHVNSNAYVHTNFRVGSGIVMNDTTGRITAGSFEGDGSAMTGINSDSGSWVNGVSSNVHLATIGDKVGIGTASPSEQLHIFHPTYGVHRSIYWSEKPGDPATQNPLKMGYLGSCSPSHASGGLGLFMNSYEDGTEDEAVRIQANGYSWFKGGNVGIGTSSPDAELHVSGTGAIVIPSGTTAQQPTGVTGMIRYNSESAGIEFYNGTVWKGIGSVSATGGNMTTSGSYQIHTFTSGSGSFTVTSGGLMDYLIVGGGGGGGGRSGGGGGAGGLVYETAINISPGTYTVIIGNGGTGGPSGSIGSNGSNSSVFGKTAVGGGGGGGDPQNGGSSGGSGGGGRYGANGGGETQTSQGYGFGNAGGNSTGASTYNGGGGGGAGAAGQTGATTYIGDGGVGRQYDISGTNKYYAGGGGGGSHNPWPGSASTGGTGGGGAGGIVNGNGTSGSTNTGGGGGAGSTDSGGGGAGGNGGSGIVIIRYTL